MNDQSLERKTTKQTPKAAISTLTVSVLALVRELESVLPAASFSELHAGLVRLMEQL